MFTIREDKKDRIIFQIKNVDLSIVNSIRRIGLSQIPNVSLDFDMEHPDYEDENSPKVNKNTSALHHEMLLHRLSLVPYCFNAEEIDDFDSSKYVFKLLKSNKNQAIATVTSKDIEIYNEKGEKYPDVFHARIFPKNHITGDHILLVKLKEGEELDIEWKLTKATAEKHVKWCPVSQFTFSYVTDMSASSKLSSASILDIQRNFVKDKWGEPAAFEFKIHSECALTPKYLFAKSIEILKNKISEVPESIKIDKPEGSDVFSVHIEGEDVTVANVLQSCIYNKCFRKDNGQSTKEIEFIGYFQPHPLVKHMVLKLKPKMPNMDIKAFMKTQCDLIVSDLENIKAEWQKISDH